MKKYADETDMLPECPRCEHETKRKLIGKNYIRCKECGCEYFRVIEKTRNKKSC